MNYRKSHKINVILWVTIACVVFCAMSFVFIPTQSVEANSADRRHYGVDSQGVIIMDEDCPIVVDKEVLTFDIYKNEPTSGGMTFASSSSSQNSNTGFYKKQVSAEYTFTNSSENEIHVNCVFPFGPYYRFDEEETDISQYGISVNGSAIEDRNLRATYCDNADYYEWDNATDFDKMRQNLCDDFKDDELFDKDKTVTAYTVKFPGLDRDKGYVIALNWAGKDAKSLISSQYMHYDYKNSIRTKYVCQTAYYIDEYVFYVIGDDVVRDDTEFLSRIEVYTDYDLKEEVSCGASIGSKSMTMQELLLQYREDDCIISEVDWYNAVLQNLNFSKGRDSLMYVGSLDVDYYLLCWFEYDLTFAPGETLLNTVTAPLYPDENGWYVPAKYEFNYLLSPASSWADFKDLRVVVNTDMYLIDNEIEGVEIGEGYYAWHYATLPDGELSFTLCEVEEPEAYSSGIGTIIVVAILVAVLPALFMCIVGVIIVVVVIKKKNKKSE